MGSHALAVFVYIERGRPRKHPPKLEALIHTEVDVCFDVGVCILVAPFHKPQL